MLHCEIRELHGKLNTVFRLKHKNKSVILGIWLRIMAFWQNKIIGSGNLFSRTIHKNIRERQNKLLN